MKLVVMVVVVLKHYALLKIWIINVSDVQFDINFCFFYTGCPQVLRFLQLQEASCPYFLCLLFAFFMEFKILLAIMSCHKCCIVSKRGVSGLWLLDRYGIVVATSLFLLDPNEAQVGFL